MDEVIPLQISFEDPSSRELKTFSISVSKDTTIRHVCDQIWAQGLFPRQLHSYLSVSDYGLFVVPQNDGSKGQWLLPDSTVAESLIDQQTAIEFRKKINKLAIRVMDKKPIEISFDVSLPVRDLIPLVCGKFGIAISEEYDLLLERDARVESPASPTPTSSKSFLLHPSKMTFKNVETYLEQKEEKRMVKLKSKLVTDDDIKWLDHNSTLAEQGVSLQDILLLKRRFFYSDGQVNRLDAAQINLLYHQCRENILSGAHPLPLSVAIKFAGLQAQIEYLDFKDIKKPFDLGQMLPQTFTNPKKATRKELEEYRMRVQVEWRTHNGMLDLQAKDEYILLAQAQKTYGVTFFLVKEKAKAKNKMVPRLFGVAKETVMRIDAKTKETLETWQLVTINRWKTTENTFSLDFGDHHAPYSMQTKEGRQIAKLIDGYLKLIQRRLAILDSPPSYDTATATNDGEMDEFEEVDSPVQVSFGTGEHVMKPTLVQSGQVALPGVIRHTLMDQHRVNSVVIAKGRVAKILADLGRPLQFPEFVNQRSTENFADEEYFEISRQKFVGHMDKIVASVGQFVVLKNAGKMEEDFESNKITNRMIDELDELASALRSMSFTTRGSPHQDTLIHLAEELCRDVEGVLSSVETEEKEQGTLTNNQKGFLSSVSKLSETSRVLATSVGHLSPKRQESQLEYAAFIEELGLATTEVVGRCGMIVNGIQDFPMKKKLILAASTVGQRSLNSITLLKLARIESQRSESADLAMESLEALKASLTDLQQFLAGDLSSMPNRDESLLEETQNSAGSFQNLIDGILVKFAWNQPVIEENLIRIDPVTDALLRVNQLMRSIDDNIATVPEQTSTGEEKPLNSETLAYLQQLNDLLNSAEDDSLESLLRFLEELTNKTSRNSGEKIDSAARILVLNYVKTLLENGYNCVSFMSEEVPNSAGKQAYSESKVELRNLIAFLSSRNGVADWFQRKIQVPKTRLHHASNLQEPITDISDEQVGELWEQIGESLKQLKEFSRGLTSDAHQANPAASGAYLMRMEGAFQELVGFWVELVDSGAVAEEEFRERFQLALMGLLEGFGKFGQVVMSVRGYGDEETFGKTRRELIQQVDSLQKIYDNVNCGTESCQRALSTIVEVDEDLETAITFASAGSTFDNNHQSPSASPEFSAEEINRLTEQLSESVKNMSHAGNQSELSTGVAETLSSLTELVDFIRKISSREPNVEKQIFNFRLLQDTARSVADVIEASKNSFSKRKSSLLQTRIEDSISVQKSVDTCCTFISSVKDCSSLSSTSSYQTASIIYKSWLQLTLVQIQTIQTKTVQETEVSTLHYQNQLEVSYRIKQMLEKGRFSSPQPSQNEVLLFINSSHEVVTKLSHVQNAELRQQFVTQLIAYFESQNRLLQSGQHDSSSANRLLELADFLENSMKRPPRSPGPPVPVRTTSRNSSTSTVISVSDDLHHAAKEIQKAADRLQGMQPRRSIYVANMDSDTDEDDAFGSPDPEVTQFDEGILEACKAIMYASAQLIPTAATAQNELNSALGNGQSAQHFNQGQWAAGFNSAARAIGSSCQKLCDAAGALMNGSGSEEKLVSAAKQVASYTAQLLVASKVKGNPNSPRLVALLHAGHGVRKTTDELVRMIKRGSRPVDDESLIEAARKTVVIDKRLVGGIAQEIKANEKLVMRERELAEAQKKLMSLRKAKYDKSHGIMVPDDLVAQELVLVKEREVAEARATLIAIRDLKYTNREAEDEYSGYGNDTLRRKLNKA